MPNTVSSDRALPRIAIVEDDEILTFLLSEISQAAGYDVIWQSPNVADALLRLGEDPPEVLLLDYALDGKRDGIELLAATQAQCPDVRTILITGWDCSRLAARIDYVRPDHLLQKPIAPRDLSDLLDTIALYLANPALARAA